MGVSPRAEPRQETSMLIQWSIVTGTLSGIGALAALAHPLTILAAILAAPVTCLHPFLAAGWILALYRGFHKKAQGY